MHYVDWMFWGMHVFWWLFWVAIVVVLFLSLTPTSRRQSERPLETLQRRYATGEITTQEYEERKTILERDA